VQTWVFQSSSLAGTVLTAGRRLPALLTAGPADHARTLQPLDAALFPEQDYRVIAAQGAGWQGFLKVAGATPCLVVRDDAAANAKELGCYRNGVLLSDLGETEIVGGRPWLKVYTPPSAGPLSGQVGYADAAFLQR
jgi:hypothetical protein